MAQPSTANDKSPRATSNDDRQLLEQLSQEIQTATSIDQGFEKLTDAFAAMEVKIERITLTKNDETSERTIDENGCGIRRDIEGQVNGVKLTITCISSMTPKVNADLQSLVTLATIAAQQWPSKTSNNETNSNSRMIGHSPQMQQLRTDITRAARSTHNVLIKGESGTGKTTAAIMIHEESPRAGEPFVDINCAALPETLLEAELFGYEKGSFTGAGNTKKGLFETADGGTLFLDEIGEMKPELQAKLLTAIEQKKIRRIGSTKDIPCNVRVITASSRNLQTMLKDRTFREDLYYRIAVLEIQISPLRERPTDIPALVNNRLSHEQELAEQTIPFQIEDAALKALAFYEWPGNIRQLQNVLSRLTARLDKTTSITAQDVFSELPHDQIDPIQEGAIVLPPAARILFPNESLQSYIARIQLLAIETTTLIEGNRGNAATRLGYRRTSLVDLLRKLSRNQLGSTDESADLAEQTVAA